MRISARRSGVVAMTTAIVLAFAGCGSGGSDGEDSTETSAVCQTEDEFGMSYNRCDLMQEEQVYVEAVIGRQFEIEGFGLPKVGQKVWLVCHTGQLGHSSFGIVVNQGNDRTDGEWTLGKVDGKPFAYVGYIVDAAITDHEAKRKELNDKLDATLDNPRSNSCEDRRIVVGDSEKAELMAG